MGKRKNPAAKSKKTEIKDNSLSWYFANRWRTSIKNGIVTDAICAINKLSDDCLDEVNLRLDNFQIVIKDNSSDTSESDDNSKKRKISKN